MMNEIGFALRGIKTEQFAVLEEHFSPKKEVELSTNFHFKLNAEEHQVGVYTTFQYEQGKKVFIKLEVSCHFEIEEETFKGFKNANQICIPVGFMRHLSVITIGTARGILHSKTENTLFNSFLIPTINVTEALKEDIVFHLSE